MKIRYLFGERTSAHEKFAGLSIELSVQEPVDIGHQCRVESIN